MTLAYIPRIYCVRWHNANVCCGGGVIDRLDGIDEQILAELAQHARATFAEIGERVRLSAPAVKRRVDRMLDRGVIRGFTTVIDRNAVGWNTEAYVQVFCHGRISPEQLRRAWVNIPEVVSAATVTGTADAILRLLAHDMQHLEDALERIRTSADIERTESIVVLSNLIDRSRAQG
jgi:DNA-binding Lrp family transcriptional regulator